MGAPTKIETVRDGTPSSIESTPEQEVGGEALQEPTQQPQKRKGGRKPIYATSEERKQRNRQAQAAFRERRTEYIKQLEATIKQNEDTLASLQQSQRTAADECLMLRYKNSLLERILLEKGIDVQAELQMKTGSPVLAPGFMIPSVGLPQVQQSQPHLQRATIQRQHARRSGQGFLPKLAPGQSSSEMSFQNPSPQGHPTPSSHASSPTNVPTRSPMTMHQGGMTPPTSAVLAQGQAQQYHGIPRSLQQLPNSSFYPTLQQSPNVQRQLQRPPPPSHYQSTASIHSSHSTTSQHSLNPPMSTGAGSAPASAGPSASAYYPKREYDEVEHLPEHENDSGLSPNHMQATYAPRFDQQPPETGDYYPHPFGSQPSQQQMPAQMQYDQPQIMPGAQGEESDQHSGPFPMGQPIDPHDPMLDADPFGLSASMHYPTSYSTMDNQPARH